MRSHAVVSSGTIRNTQVGSSYILSTVNVEAESIFVRLGCRVKSLSIAAAVDATHPRVLSGRSPTDRRASIAPEAEVR